MTLNHDEKAREIKIPVCNCVGECFCPDSQEVYSAISKALKEVEEEARKESESRLAKANELLKEAEEALLFTALFNRPVPQAMTERDTVDKVSIPGEVIRKAQESLSAIRKYRSG